MVIYVAGDIAKSIKYSKENKSDNPFPPELIEEYFNRMEEPNHKSRTLIR
jgi:tRNA uridine 5-carbamoylmethylation protein Kti12